MLYRNCRNCKDLPFCWIVIVANVKIKISVLIVSAQYPYWKNLFETPSIPFLGSKFEQDDTPIPPITVAKYLRH